MSGNGEVIVTLLDEDGKVMGRLPEDWWGDCARAWVMVNAGPMTLLLADSSASGGPGRLPEGPVPGSRHPGRPATDATHHALTFSLPAVSSSP